MYVYTHLSISISMYLTVISSSFSDFYLYKIKIYFLNILTPTDFNVCNTVSLRI